MGTPDEFVAQQIAGQADAVQGQPVSQQQLAEQVQATAGIGVTEVDVGKLADQIRDMQARLEAAEQRDAKDTKTPFREHVKTLQGFLAAHGDPRAVELGNDLAEAAEGATQTGDGSHAAKASDRLVRYLANNPPYPGENYSYRNAVAFAKDTADHIDALTPPAVPGKVVQGAVVG